MLTPSDGSRAEGFRQLFWKATDVEITRISLGLMKVVMRDSDVYKLIPAWSFFGRDNLDTDMEDAIEECRLTINAMDGSIVDRGVMY